MQGKSAAIPADQLDTPLEKLTAAQFLESLQKSNGFELLRYWPEKKKYELEVEPGIIGRLRLGDLIEIIERIKGEKKKVEYEFDFWRDKLSVEVDVGWGSRLGPFPLPWRMAIGQQLDQLAQKLDRLAAQVGQRGQR